MTVNTKGLTADTERALGKIRLWDRLTGRKCYHYDIDENTIGALVRRGFVAYTQCHEWALALTLEGRVAVRELVADAEASAATYLANGNAADEAGDRAKAERAWTASQRYLDRANRLRGNDSADCLASLAKTLRSHRETTTSPSPETHHNLKITKATIVRTDTDVIYLHTNLPIPVWPYTGTATLKLETPPGHAEPYLQEHFPGLEVEVIDACSGGKTT